MKLSYWLNNNIKVYGLMKSISFLYRMPAWQKWSNNESRWWWTRTMMQHAWIKNCILLFNYTIFMFQIALCSHFATFEQHLKISTNETYKSNISNTLFTTPSLTLILLFSETNVTHSTLCGFYFQSVSSTLILFNKRVSVEKSVKKKVLVALLKI